jgi:hypothetical protein
MNQHASNTDLKVEQPRLLIAFAASALVRRVAEAPLRAAGLDPVFIDWTQNALPASAFPEGAAALVVAALGLRLRTRPLADALLAFPRRAAEAARSAGIKHVIYAVPEVRGLADETGAALRSSVVMMQHGFKANVLRCGLLTMLGGLLEGASLGPLTFIAGQGWGEAHPLTPSDFSAAVSAAINHARRVAKEDPPPSKPPSWGVASTIRPAPLADLVQLTKGGCLRLHLPLSLIVAYQAWAGASLEERALFTGGSLKVEENDLERLTGSPPVPLANLARGKVPTWISHLESSR